LKKVEGVEVQSVEVGSAEVLIDPARTAPEAVLEAVERIGFQARSA
jgi:copper chaperone CopZ